MKKIVEVIAKSNFRTMVIMRSEVEKGENLAMEVSYAMYRVKELNTKDEKFELEIVRVMDI